MYTTHIVFNVIKRRKRKQTYKTHIVFNVIKRSFSADECVLLHPPALTYKYTHTYTTILTGCSYGCECSI